MFRLNSRISPLSHPCLTTMDHCPVVFDFAVPKLSATQNPQSSSPCLSTRLDFPHTDWQELNDHLWKVPLLATVRNVQTVDDAWSSRRTMLEDAVFSFVQVIQGRVFPTNKPWFAATDFGNGNVGSVSFRRLSV